MAVGPLCDMPYLAFPVGRLGKDRDLFCKTSVETKQKNGEKKKKDLSAQTFSGSWGIVSWLEGLALLGL